MIIGIIISVSQRCEKFQKKQKKRKRFVFGTCINSTFLYLCKNL